MVTIKEKITSIPHAPGVYLYKDETGSIIYVGKAIDLYKRVRQYFQRSDLLSPKTQLLIAQIRDIETIKTVSEFDALLLEANLIRHYQPKYNIIAKDDKSPLYIRILFHESLPHIQVVRKTKLNTLKKNDFEIGPFQSTRIAKSILYTIRRIIPYCTQKKRNGYPCFYTHIGLCNPCPSQITSYKDEVLKKETTKYRKQLYLIRDILLGKSSFVQEKIEKELKISIHNEWFEQAAVLRDRIKNLEQLRQRHFDPSLYMNDQDAIGEKLENEAKQLQDILHPYYDFSGSIHRIECFDISNTAGTNPTGSLVTLLDGKPDSSRYRRFKITSVTGPNDTAMMADVVYRRFLHKEWTFPDLIIVDGGVGQVRAALYVLEKLQIRIPLIGLAKRFESIVVPVNGSIKQLHIPTTSPAIHLLQRVRDEAHRFAITYHKAIRKKKFVLDNTQFD